MDINRICIGCMSELPQSGGKCPYCGYQNSPEQNNEPYHHLKPYSILAGKYLVGNVLGEGGFGITYIGLDLNLEMKVAIKEFYPNGFVTREGTVTSMVTDYAGANMQAVQKWKDGFIREARTLAKCSNLSGIVGVKDFFQENNTAYIIMEYLEGETLKEYLKKRGGKLPVEEVLGLMRPVISSLAHMHEQGVIHRDISPDNIMVLPGGNVKLLDLGAARDYATEGEKSLSVMLKPGYAPEEQYRTKGKQGPWSDVYALCGTIYKCITGITPPEAMERMRDDALQKPSSLGVAISKDKEEVILKGMAVFAEKRIQNMNELYSLFYGNKENTEISIAESHNEANKRELLEKENTVLTKGAQAEWTDKIKQIPAKYYYLAGIGVVILGLAIMIFSNMGKKTEAEAVASTEDVVEEEAVVQDEETQEDYVALAEEAFLNEQYEDVLSYCNMEILSDPQNEEAYFLEAKTYLAMEDPVQALTVLKQGNENCKDSELLQSKIDEIRESVVPVACDVYNSMGAQIGKFGYEDGKQLEYTSYSDGVENAHEYFEYDSDGNMISLDHYENGILMFEEIYEYDDGVKTGTYRYNDRGTLEWSELYDNDSQGRCTATYRYGSGTSLSWWDEYVYGANGNYQKIAHPHPNTSTVYNCKAEYDNDGNIVEYQEIDPSGQVNYSWKKEYDVFGNLTKYSYDDREQNYVYLYSGL